MHTVWFPLFPSTLLTSSTFALALIQQSKLFGIEREVSPLYWPVQAVIFISMFSLHRGAWDRLCCRVLDDGWRNANRENQVRIHGDKWTSFFDIVHDSQGIFCEKGALWCLYYSLSISMENAVRVCVYFMCVCCVMFICVYGVGVGVRVYGVC